MTRSLSTRKMLQPPQVDPELEAIRQRRMAELAAQQGKAPMSEEEQQQQEEAKAAAEEQRRAMLMALLQPAARERRKLHVV